MDLSAHEQKRSPWIWFTYRVPPSRKKLYHKTTIRKDDPDKERKVALELNSFERTLLQQGVKLADNGDDWGWVEPWLIKKFRAKDNTLRVYRAQWDSLYVYIREEEISEPALFSREYAYDYADWRTGQIKAKSGKNPSINTAKGELKLLSQILDEAKERRYISENPCTKLGIAGEDSPLKPEILPEAEGVIIKALAISPDWMMKSFCLGLLTGLRFKETRIHRSQVRWADDEILIEKPKGGRKREFCIPIYDSIRPMLEDFWNSGREYMWDLPSNDSKPVGIQWREFFDRLNMPDYCFHCTRVTFITRGMRANITEKVMMKMVNHGSSLVNRIYQRWTSSDVRAAAALLPSHSAAAAIAQNRSGKPSGRGTKGSRTSSTLRAASSN